MSRLGALGYIANEVERLPCALHELRTTLAAPADNTGFGLAHYVDDRLLLNARPSAVKAGTSLEELAGPQRTGALVCGFHAPGQLGPYKFRAWSGMVVGGTQDAGRVAGLLQGVPDYLQRNLSASGTCGENAFHRFLAALYESGRAEDPNLAPSTVAAALRAAVEGASETGRHGAAMLVSNGRMMLGMHMGADLSYALREGILACQRCDMDKHALANFPLRESHRRFRGVMIVTGLGAPTAFMAVPGGRAIAVTRKLDVQLLD